MKQILKTDEKHFIPDNKWQFWNIVDVNFT